MQKMRLLGNRSNRKLQKILQIPHLSNTFIRSCVTPGVNHLKIYGIDRAYDKGNEIDMGVNHLKIYGIDRLVYTLYNAPFGVNHLKIYGIDRNSYCMTVLFM